jgi:hypothetical protein
MHSDCRHYMETAPSTYWLRGWMRLRAVLEAVEKRKIDCLSWESNSDSSIVQPKSGGYAD